MLLALAAQKGDVVSKDDLLGQVWPDTFVEEANLSVNVAALRKVLGKREDGTSYIETIPKRGYRLVGAEISREPERRALAILPFRVLGGQADDQYLGLGLTDALITRLGRFPSLAVRPTRSVLRHGEAPDARQAGRTLLAARVVDGSLQRAGSRLRLSLQLLDVDSPGIAWSAVLEEDAAALFQLQDRAAEELARALGVATDPGPRASVPIPPTSEAYRAYLKGRYFWSRFTGPWLEKALAFFHESAEFDPAYAPPHAGIAQLDLVLGFSGMVAPRDAWEAAEGAAGEALARDAGLADAHVALAYVRLFRDWDWRRAEQSLARAVAAEPNSAAAHQWHALFLLILGRTASARDALVRAEAEDPLSLIGAALTGLQGQLGEDDQATLDACRRTLELEPGHFLGYWGLGLALQQQGRHDEAIAAHGQALALSGDAPLLRPVLARSLALAGHTEEAQLAIDAPTAGAAFPSSYQKATVELALGQQKRALDSLERACDERDPWVVLMRADRLLAPLRGEPRFQALLLRVFADAP